MILDVFIMPRTYFTVQSIQYTFLFHFSIFFFLIFWISPFFAASFPSMDRYVMVFGGFLLLS